MANINGALPYRKRYFKIINLDHLLKDEEVESPCHVLASFEAFLNNNEKASTFRILESKRGVKNFRYMFTEIKGNYVVDCYYFEQSYKT